MIEQAPRSPQPSHPETLQIGETRLQLGTDFAEPLHVWLQKLCCDHCVLNDLGSTLFTTIDAVVNSAKIFVQTKVASSQTHGLDPEAIFALFLFCLDSNIQFKCCQVMVDEVERRGGTGNDSPNGSVQLWSPLIVSVQKALGRLRPTTDRVLFRAVGFNGRRPEMLSMLKNYHEGAKVVWTPFTSCTPMLNVAAPWLNDRNAAGVIFMIRACKNAKSVSDFTLNPWQSEAMFAAGECHSWIEVCPVVLVDLCAPLFFFRPACCVCISRKLFTVAFNRSLSPWDIYAALIATIPPPLHLCRVCVQGGSPDATGRGDAPNVRDERRVGTGAPARPRLCRPATSAARRPPDGSRSRAGSHRRG